MNDILADLSEGSRQALREESLPETTSPMLATLHDEPFSREGWIYERKLDGVRILAFRDGGDVRLLTRNGEERGSSYFELRDALEAEGETDLVLDGEVVTFDGDVTSFSRLQDRMQVRDEEEARARSDEVPVVLYCFDILHLDGHDLTDLALRTRKSILKKAIEWEDPLRFTPHRNRDGVDYWKEACRKGWEGVIAKDGDSTYCHTRSTDWLKFKCVNRQELVVGGFTEPQGDRVGFGAILVGYHEDDELRYAGKVGTGWDDDSLEELRDRMDRLERETPPFSDHADLPSDRVHWITPKLVAEVGFTEWTDDGKLRHPRFIGLRTDKDAEDVVRERPGESS